MVERTKEASALILLENLKNVMQQPDDSVVQYLCGLMTKVEIEKLVVRGDIRRKILESLKENGRASLGDIARELDCSRNLVTLVWRDMRDEYPAAPSACAVGFSVALPKEDRAQELVENILLNAGFRVDMTDRRNRRGMITDIRNGMEPIQCQIIAGQDIPVYIKSGAMQAAFLGNDKIIEARAAATQAGRGFVPLEVRKQFAVNAFRMCLAVPYADRKEAAAKSYGFLEDKVIATSYPATLKDFLASKKITARDILPLKGGVEQAMKMLGADAIMDIVETGGSLRANNLVTLGEPVYQGDMSLVAAENPWRMEPKGSIVERFLDRLAA